MCFNQKAQDNSMTCTSTSNILGLAGQKKALLSVLVVLLTTPLLPSSVNPNSVNADSSLLKDTEGRRKKNLMIRPRLFSLVAPLPSGIKLFFSQTYTDTPKNPILSTCIHSITI